MRTSGNQSPLTQLSGNHFHLDIGKTPVNFTGADRFATSVNRSLPGPILHWKEGQTVTIKVTNHLKEPTSIHWHGILLPFRMDGVPGISFPGIAPGKTFTYRFPVKQSGTYWYHSHSGFQEQVGLYGPLVIEPAEGERYPTERDYVVMLNDWTDNNPLDIFQLLKKQSDFYNFNEPTVMDFLHDVRTEGLETALQKRRMWNLMRMSPTDLSDVTGYAYTYLMNGMTASDNWSGLFKRGEKVRLRFINGSAMTYFDVRIPGLKMTVVAADGQDVEPVTVDEFRIAVAETYDVIVEPTDDRAWTIFAQNIDRSGFVRGTLTPHPGLAAPVPPMDKPQQLTMMDMMGNMPHGEGHEMPGMAGMEGMKGMPNMPHHGMTSMNMDTMPKSSGVRHAVTEFDNPGVAMRMDHPRTNLDDPGIGLRNNGRRCLTYADLHTIGGSIDPREPSREIELHLTGNMQRYVWSFDGVKFAEAKPIHFRYGEKLRIKLVNDTMMNHPIHLHGMWSEIENPEGRFQVRKHTVNVRPAQRVCYDVTADALGRWAYHCHLLYHMDAGMFREVVVS
jgi:CopA family copper-resistance protein